MKKAKFFMYTLPSEKTTSLIISGLNRTHLFSTGNSWGFEKQWLLTCVVHRFSALWTVSSGL